MVIDGTLLAIKDGAFVVIGTFVGTTVGAVNGFLLIVGESVLGIIVGLTDATNFIVGWPVTKGTKLGTLVGSEVNMRLFVGSALGLTLKATLGLYVGLTDELEGTIEGRFDGTLVGNNVGDNVGLKAPVHPTKGDKTRSVELAVDCDKQLSSGVDALWSCKVAVKLPLFIFETNNVKRLIVSSDNSDRLLSFCSMKPRNRIDKL